jgi:ankyrin repeat protein
MTTPTTTPQEIYPELIEQFVLAAHGNFVRVRELYALEPALLNMKFEKFDENALEAAGHMGRRDIAEWLLAEGAPMTIYAAAMLGDTERVGSFLRADPTLAGRPGVHGFSVLFHAALSGKVEIADLLEAHGGLQGTGAALNGATGFGHLEMARWLLDHGADVNSPDFQGRTPLETATELGLSEIADLLRERGGSG